MFTSASPLGETSADAFFDVCFAHGCSTRMVYSCVSFCANLSLIVVIMIASVVRIPSTTIT